MDQLLPIASTAYRCSGGILRECFADELHPAVRARREPSASSIPQTVQRMSSQSTAVNRTGYFTFKFVWVRSAGPKRDKCVVTPSRIATR